MKYYVTINDKRYEVEVERGKATLISTTEIAMGVANAEAPSVAEAPAPKAVAEAPAAQPIVTPEAPKAATNISGEGVKAPMPGGIIDVKVSVGARVKKGDTLLILEAMKMENEITAPRDGVIAQIMVSKGATVAINDVLLTIQ